MKKANRAGFTLMELLVYMGIVGIIVVVAGEAFSNSTKFRIRTDNMVKATQEAENVAMLFKEDAEQMGAKSAIDVGNAADGSDNFTSVYSEVYMSPTNEAADQVDLSSFLIATNNGQSDITFRRLRYNSAGLYVAVEEVRWFVDNSKNLKRCCRTIAGLAATECPSQTGDEAVANAVVMATGVSLFNVVAPKPTVGAEQQVFPSVGDEFRLIPRTGDLKYQPVRSMGNSVENGAAAEIVLSNFYTNFDNEENQLKDDLENRNEVIAINTDGFEGGEPNNWHSYCRDRGRVTLLKDNTYEISFEVPFNSMSQSYSVNPFVVGEDHMSVGFRGVETGNKPILVVNGVSKVMVDDFMFYPPYSAQGRGKRYMRFTVPENIDTVCLAFTFACYSPLASKSRLKIKNLKINRIAGLNYDFSEAYNPEAHKNDKKNIKALKLQLRVSRGAKNNQSGETGEVNVVVPIPSNGPSD